MWWPFIEYLGLGKIGPAKIKVGGELDITNESPTGDITEKHPIISATIKSCQHEIDPDSIQMTLDDALVPISVDQNEDEVNISYQPDYNLDDGKHTVVVNASTLDGFYNEEKKCNSLVSIIISIISNIKQNQGEHLYFSLSAL